jgi:hypothetical protein
MPVATQRAGTNRSDHDRSDHDRSDQMRADGHASPQRRPALEAREGNQRRRSTTRTNQSERSGDDTGRDLTPAFRNTACACSLRGLRATARRGLPMAAHDADCLGLNKDNQRSGYKKDDKGCIYVREKSDGDAVDAVRCSQRGSLRVWRASVTVAELKDAPGNGRFHLRIGVDCTRDAETGKGVQPPGHERRSERESTGTLRSQRFLIGPVQQNRLDIPNVDAYSDAYSDARSDAVVAFDRLHRSSYPFPRFYVPHR